MRVTRRLELLLGLTERNITGPTMAALLNGSPPGQTPAPAAPLTTAGGQTLRHTPGATPAPGAPFVVRTVAALTPPAAHSGLAAADSAATAGHSQYSPVVYIYTMPEYICGTV